MGTLDYFLEGDHLESVYKANKIQEKYFRGLSIDELVAGFTMQNNKLTPFFFQHDQVNSVVAVSKPNGGTQQKATFRAFGEDQSSTGTAVTRLKYTGREDDGAGLYQYRARYYDPKVGRFISEDPKGFAAGVNFYAYVNNNPINANDPSGQWAVIDDAIFTVGGGVLGVGGQAISNLVTGKGIVPANSGRDYTAAFVGGAVGGEALLYSPVAGPAGPYLAGAAGGLANNLVKQGIDQYNTPGYQWDVPSTLFDTSVGTLTGLIGGVKIPGLSSGRNSFNAIFNQITTKFDNGTISNLTTETALKMFVGKNTESATLPVSGMTSLLSSGYDWAKEQLGFSGGTGSSAAAGGFVIYPNKSNNNMQQQVYQK